MTFQYSGIYQIRNLSDGKRYIGSAVSIARRFRQHRCALRKGTRTNARLLNAWNKYGEKSFVFEVLVRCSAEDLVFYEQICIDELSPEYNIRRDAASNLGIKLSPETRRRISEVQRGIPKGPQSEAHRKANSLARIGMKLSDSHKRRISEAKKGRPNSEAHNRNIGLAQVGRVVSQETREKLRISCRRNRAKLSDSDVRDVRRRIRSGEKQRDIASRYGVDQAVVSHIKTGHAYGWVV